MVWACLTAAGIGLAIGFRFRVPMLLAATVVTTAVVVAVAIHSGWSVPRALGVMVLLAVIEHVAYLVGLLGSARGADRTRSDGVIGAQDGGYRPDQ